MKVSKQAFLVFNFLILSIGIQAQVCPLTNNCLVCDTSNWSNGSTSCAGIAIQSCSIDTGLPSSCFPGFGFSSENLTCETCNATSFSPGQTSGCLPCPNSELITMCDGSSGNATGCINGYDLVESNCLSSTYTTSNCTGENVWSCNARHTELIQSCSGGYSLIYGKCIGNLAGTYSTNGSNSTAQNCSANTYSDDLASSCFDCPLYYSSIPGSDCVINCPNGTYVDSSGSDDSDNDNSTCTNCEANAKTCAFNNSTKIVDSLVCLPGYSVNIPVYLQQESQHIYTSNTSCKSCPQGSYSDGFLDCTPCSPGEGDATCSGTSGNITSCLAPYNLVDNSCVFAGCAAGHGFKHISILGAKSKICSECVAGSFSPNSTAACALCPLNTYTNGSASSCTPCDMNSFTNSTGSASCTSCGVGYYRVDSDSLLNDVSQCVQCTDSQAATCNATGITGTLTCVANYSLINGVCTPLSFQRFYGYNLPGSDLGEAYVANSESACWSHCEGSLPLGKFQNFVYQKTNSICFCKSSTINFSSAALVLGSGFVSSIAGVCSNNTSTDSTTTLLHPLCQTVKYSQSGCIAIDGTACTSSDAVTTIGCTDFNAQSCDSLHLELSLTCVAGYGISSSGGINHCIPCLVGSWSNGTIACGSCITNNVLACSLTTGMATVCTVGYNLINGTCSVPIVTECKSGSFRNTAGVCSNCLSDGVASCDASGIATSCLTNYGLTPSKSLLGISDVLVCTPCLAGYFSPSNTTTTCTACTDKHAAICKGLNGNTSITCVGNYTLSATGVCVAQSFSRFYGYTLYGNDLGSQHTINSEAACAAYCESSSSGYSSPVSFVFQAANNLCLCKAGTLSTYASLILVPGFTSNLVGLCSDNIASNLLTSTHPCQDVVYSSNGCLGIDGSACTTTDAISTIGCLDSNAQSCNSLHLDISLTCLPGFSLVASTSISGNTATTVTRCTACPSGTFTNGTSSVCTSCLTSFAISECSPTTGDTTGCTTGYTLINGTCAISAVTTKCRDPNAATCNSLTLLTSGCKAGYGFTYQSITTSGAATVLVMPLCVACPAGSFSILGNLDICTPCPLNTISTNTSASCTPCTSGSITIAIGSSACVPSTCAVGTYRTSTGLCTNCLVTGAANCDPVSGNITACLANYGLVISTKIPSIVSICTPCSVNTFTLGGTAQCSQCTDPQAATCNATGITGTLTCVANYSLINGVCTPLSFQRFYGYNLPGSDLGEAYVATSESACWSHCEGSLPLGKFQNFVYQKTNSICFCKSSTINFSSVALVLGSGFVSSIAGVCSNTTSTDSTTTLLHPLCQTVKYSQSGCIAIDGTACTSSDAVTTIGCTDFNAQSCDSLHLELSLTCFAGYGVSSSGGINHCIPCLVGSWSNGAIACASCITNNVLACSLTTGMATVCTVGYNLINGTCSVPIVTECKSGYFRNTSGVCSNCLSDGVASCDASGIATSCLTNYGLTPSKSLLGISSVLVCTPCLAGYFSPSNTTTTCTACTDKHAAICKGLNGNTSITCVGNYTLSATGVCVVQSFSRFYGYSLYGNDLGIQHTINSEAACAAYCESSSSGYSSPVSFVFQAANNLCLCKAGTLSTYASLILVPGFTSNLVGLCSDNIASNLLTSTHPCQDVVYSSNGCLGIDGSACTTTDAVSTIGCLDSNAQSCNALHLDISLTCLPGFSLVASTSISGSTATTVTRCTACPSGTFTNGTSSVCTSCLTSTVSMCSPTTGLALNCVSNYRIVAGVCIGPISTSFGCTGKFASTCATQSLATTLTCSAGYGFVGTTCTGCAAGFYSIAGSNTSCIACPVGQFSATLAAVCSPCGANTYAASTGSTSCTNCLTGQTSIAGSSACTVNTVNTICSIGFYRPVSGFECIACPDLHALSCGISATSNTVSTLTCLPNYSLISNVCQPIQFARFIDIAVHSYDIMGSSSSTTSSEFGCLKSCWTANPINGPLSTFQYSNGMCYCKQSTLAAIYLNEVYSSPGTVVNMVGSCPTYKNLLLVGCQNVQFSANGTCSGIDSKPCQTATVVLNITPL